MNNEVFENMPVGKAVRKMAIPSIISMLGVIVYNMADTFFVGQTGNANMVAAVSLAMPIFMFFIALGNMFGVGGNSLISRLFGEGKTQRAKKVSSFCFYGALGAGVLMIAALLLGMNGILNMVGASEATFELAKSYLTIVTLGAPFVIVSNAFSQIIRAEGASKEAMIGITVGNLVNVVLDPIFILVFKMGVEGAAWATVLGNVVATAYYIYYLKKKNSQFSISPKDFKLEKRDMGQLFAIGVPASINNLLMSVANILLNILLAGYTGGDVYVAAMGVAMKASMLLVLVQMGFAMGIQSLIGYCHGSQNYERIKQIVKYTITWTVIIGSVVTVMYLLGGKQIIRLFINDEAVVSSGISMLYAHVISGPVIGVLFVMTYTLQAMGEIKMSMLLNVSRQGIIFIPALYLLHFFFGLNGVIYTQTVADVVSFGIAIILYLKVVRRLEENDPAMVQAVNHI